MRDSLKRSVIVLACLLPITTVALILLRDTVRTTIVVPLLYLVWLSELTFNSIHQAVFWGLLLALTVVGLFLGMRPKREARPPVHWAGEMPWQESRRVAFWARQFVRDGNELVWDFYAQLQFRKLILAVWAYRRRVGLADLEQKVKAGAVELPPELRAYFEQDRDSSVAPLRYVERVVSRLRALVGSTDAAPSASEAALDVAVRMLETEVGTDGPQPPAATAPPGPAGGR
jgi:hypothetical protein